VVVSEVDSEIEDVAVEVTEAVGIVEDVVAVVDAAVEVVVAKRIRNGSQ